VNNITVSWGIPDTIVCGYILKAVIYYRITLGKIGCDMADPNSPQKINCNPLSRILQYLPALLMSFFSKPKKKS
jgi:hypothetical protein